MSLYALLPPCRHGYHGPLLYDTGMDLSSPTETVCPLHAAIGEPHVVEIKENSSEKPYFQCERLKTTVNIHAEDGEDYARELREITEQTGMLSEPDESDGDGGTVPDKESGDGRTLADIINENNDES